MFTKKTNKTKQTEKEQNRDYRNTNSKTKTTDLKQETQTAEPGKKWYIKLLEPKQNQNENTNRQIIRITLLFAGLFIVLGAYLIHFTIVDSGTIVKNSFNQRIVKYGENVVRGNIVSSNGKVLATTKIDDEGEEKRDYPYKRMFSHVVGIDSHGKMGIESIYNKELLTSNSDVISQIYKSIKEEKKVGDNVILNLDTRLQSTAYEALGDHNGAVVAMDPTTGKILAMVSKPDFNPNKIDEMWENYISDDSKSNLLNRATQGLYAPGSTFKIVTALEYLKEHGNDDSAFSYDCDGTIKKNSVKISCYGGKEHGKENLNEAMAYSCNCAFVELGTGLNIKKYKKTCESLLFNTEIPFELDTKKSSFVLNSKSPKGEIPQTVIGQGNTLVTPFHMALITSAVANNGILMQPYLVDRIENSKGSVIKQYKEKEYGELMTADEAGMLKQYMRSVVDFGTGSKLHTDAYMAAGKTGTAENSSGKDHAWFTGYASMNGKKIVVTVIVEKAGSGGTYAVPVAKEMFDSYRKIVNG